MTQDDNSRQLKQRKTKDIEDRARLMMQLTLDGPLTLEGSVWNERLVRASRFEKLRTTLSDDSDLNKWIKMLVEGGKPVYPDETGEHADAAFELDEYIRALCADRIERDLPPSPWRDYALRTLRQAAPPSKRATQRNGRLHRDYMISCAVLLAEYAGLAPTRNQAQRYKDGAAHSACSLVADDGV